MLMYLVTSHHCHPWQYINSDCKIMGGEYSRDELAEDMARHGYLESCGNVCGTLMIMMNHHCAAATCDLMLWIPGRYWAQIHQSCWTQQDQYNRNLSHLQSGNTLWDQRCLFWIIDNIVKTFILMLWLPSKRKQHAFCDTCNGAWP